jgi:hypothetical protein
MVIVSRQRRWRMHRRGHFVAAKGLACVAIEYLSDGEFRKPGRKDFELKSKEMLSSQWTGIMYVQKISMS